MIVVMVFLNWVIAFWLHLRFVDISFFVGLAFVAFSRTFSYPSKDNDESKLNYDDNLVRNETGITVNRDRRGVVLNVPFFLSLAYTVLGLIGFFVR
jgi:hypothetical protein